MEELQPQTSLLERVTLLHQNYKRRKGSQLQIAGPLLEMTELLMQAQGMPIASRSMLLTLAISLQGWADEKSALKIVSPDFEKLCEILGTLTMSHESDSALKRLAVYYYAFALAATLGMMGITDRKETQSASSIPTWVLMRQILVQSEGLKRIYYEMGASLGLPPKKSEWMAQVVESIVIALTSPEERQEALGGHLKSLLIKIESSLPEEENSLKGALQETIRSLEEQSFEGIKMTWNDWLEEQGIGLDALLEDVKILRKLGLRLTALGEVESTSSMVSFAG